MKNLLKHFSLLMFIGAALLLVQGCGDDSGDSGDTPPRDRLEGYEGAQKTLVQRFAGDTGTGKQWQYSSFIKTGGGESNNVELTGWSGFKVEFELKEDDDVDADKEVLSFRRVGALPVAITTEMSTTEAARVWPSPGAFKVTGDDAAERTGATAVKLELDGSNIKVTLTLAAPPSSVEARVEGLTPDARGTWTMKFVPVTSN